MTGAAFAQDAGAVGLALRGAFAPKPDPVLPAGTQSLLLLGPDEPAFWPLFHASPEYADGAPDRLDRWSKRVIGGLAAQWGGTAIYPSDGPPYPPFLGWATASGSCWSSPVGLLVHQEAGLWISFRGAVALPYQLSVPAPAPASSPCEACSGKPCLTACPVQALSPDGYDVPACQSYIRSDSAQTCRTGGCQVRAACPVSQGFGRLPQQAHFHMQAFLRE